MSIEPPKRPCDRRSEPVPVDLEILPKLERILELAAGCFASVETDGLSILIERDPELVVGLSIRIDRLWDEDTDGVLALIELPIRDLLLELTDCCLEIEIDGVLPPIEPPMRDLLLRLLLIEVEPVELLLIEVLDDGPREIEGLDGLEIVTRLDVDPPGFLLEDIVVERLGVDRRTEMLLELLRPRADRLDEIELERLIVDRFVVGILPMDAGLGPEVFVLDRLGVGALLADDRLKLLRLDVVGRDRLVVVGLLADDRLTLLRLDVIGRDGLGVGALLTDDLLALLRLDVTDLVEDLADRELLLLDERAETLALAAGADLAACVL
ncbi:MAG: hypothetical protein ACYSWO_02400 [Planctomycetota bacterium]